MVSFASWSKKSILAPATSLSRQRSKKALRDSGVCRSRLCFHSQIPTCRCVARSTNALRFAGVHRRPHPYTPRWRPLPPDAFDDVVLEAQGGGELGEVFQPLVGVVAAVEVAPDRASRLDPRGRLALRKQGRIGRRREVVDDVVID